MGRPRLPLQCSKCGRPPTEVKLLSNRYCTDCMRAYNQTQKQRIKEAQVTQGTAKSSMIMSPDEEWIWDNYHWEEYVTSLHGPKTNVVHKDFDEMN